MSVATEPDRQRAAEDSGVFGKFCVVSMFVETGFGRRFIAPPSLWEPSASVASRELAFGFGPTPWGDVNNEDRHANQRALAQQGRLFGRRRGTPWFPERGRRRGRPHQPNGAAAGGGTLVVATIGIAKKHGVPTLKAEADWAGPARSLDQVLLRPGQLANGPA